MRPRSANDWYNYIRSEEVARSVKGVPIPGTGHGVRGFGENKTKNHGVIGGSHIVTKWDDEGEKGTLVNREIRRKERALWMAEAIAEMEEEFYSLMDEPDF